MSSATVIALLVRSPKAFQWLGHMPVLFWCLQQLREVRGIDRLLCLASPDLFARTKDLLRKEDLQLLALPEDLRKASERKLEHWLLRTSASPVKTNETVGLLRPTFPFMSAAKIENCVDLVQRDFADITCTAREVKVRNQYGQAPIFAEVESCRVFSLPRLQETTQRFRPVVVSMVEAIDFQDVEGRKLAKALVEINA